MRVRLVFLLTVFLAFAASGSSAEEHAPKASQQVSQSGAAPPATFATPKAADQSSEVALLKAQIELMQRYDDRLVNTVYWCLSAMLAIAAAVTFLGWYANFRLHDHDRKQLLAETEQALNTQVTQLRSQADVDRSRMAELLATVREEMSSKMREANTAIETRLINTAQASAAAHKEELARLEKSVSSIESSLSRLNHSLDMLRYKHFELEDKVHQEMGNAFARYVTYREKLAVAIDLGFEFAIENALNGLLAVMPTQTQFDLADMSTLEKVLEKVGDTYKSKVDAIRVAAKAVVRN